MKPRIEMLPEKKLAGKSMKMALANDKTIALWRSFMPKRHLINNITGPELYAMQVYDQPFDFGTFTPQTIFTKWAVVEVSDFKAIPEYFETYSLDGGLYAVFVHRGPASDFHKTFEYIFDRWLPDSQYTLDQRPHFELLTETYNPADPNAEEEVWIPVKKKEKGGN